MWSSSLLLPFLLPLVFSLLLTNMGGVRAHAAANFPRVVINEVLYDASGSDTGFEFVELLNVSDALVSLAGYSLEAGDGAGPGRWREVWRGERDHVLPAGARFLIGEAEVTPTPHAIVSLTLQNGPDAVRLVSPIDSLQVVGWGEHVYAEYFTGTPAEDVPAGFSLGRSPDGVSTGSDREDFVAFSPATPGAANVPEIDVAVVPRSVRAGGEWMVPGQSQQIRATLVNRGLVPLRAGEVRISLWLSRLPGYPIAEAADVVDGGATPDSAIGSRHNAEDWAPGDSLEVSLEWTPLRNGAYRLAVTGWVLDDGVLGNDRAERLVRVGSGPVLISEIFPAPPPGEPEWIELRGAGERVLDLNHVTIEDATGKPSVLRDAPLAPLAPGEWVVLTEDVPLFLALHPELDPHRVYGVQPWPRLNNTSSGVGEPADIVIVRDDRGVLSDLATYPGGGSDGGYSWERRSYDTPSHEEWNWGVSALEGGTPLAANSVLSGPPPGASLALSTRRWDPEHEARTLTVSYRLGWERAIVRVSVFDLRGRERGRIHDGPSGAIGVVDWDGRDGNGKPLPSGSYVLALEARPADGAGQLRLVEPLVLFR